MNLAFPTLEQFANTHNDYLLLLYEKEDYIAGMLPDYKTQHTQDSSYCINVSKTLNIFRRWLGIFSTTFIISQKGTTKFHQDYIHLLVINTILDSIQHKLRHMESRVLLTHLISVGTN